MAVTISKIKSSQNCLILTGKKHVIQIYKKELHTKNHIDWIKNIKVSQISLKVDVQPDTRILVTCIPDPVDILEFFPTF